ncbi:DNA repair protein RecN [Urechidicola sp. KH5]
MLSHLTITNYALIDQLSVSFDKGLSIITGETGAGKSILLGALGLVLGKRADSSTLKNTEKKCIIEAQFDIEAYNLNVFFDEVDLDYDHQTIIRREILPSGKSRAFVNDTPTTINVLQSVGQQLIDVHSQYQTLTITEIPYQFYILDTLAKNTKLVASYKRGLLRLKEVKKELDVLKNEQKTIQQQFEYHQFLLKELDEANFKVGEQKEIEEELAILNNVEVVKEKLSEVIELAENESYGISSTLYTLNLRLHEIGDLGRQYQQLSERTESIKIEFKDILDEVERAFESVVNDPERLSVLNNRLQLLLDLYKKHQVSSIEELSEIHKTLLETVYKGEHAQQFIEEKEAQIQKISTDLNTLATKIHKNRKGVIPLLIEQLENQLAELGMENVRFNIELDLIENFESNGKDKLSLLFSANKGVSFGSLKKQASGGELSRIMLVVKAILAEHINLPTIIFDEIDTGVSGEVANKMGGIMQNMSNTMQVVSITHLPQIAAKGNQHYKVFKEENKSGIIHTQLQQLNQEERVVEIAEMLGGKDLSESAISHAKSLLG